MTERETGTVAWFDPARGFGFIRSDEAGAPDIYMQATGLIDSVGKGDRVEFEILDTPGARGS